MKKRKMRLVADNGDAWMFPVEGALAPEVVTWDGKCFVLHSIQPTPEKTVVYRQAKTQVLE